MKKMKKIWMLALLAAGFAMVLGGCKNSTSEKPSDQNQGNNQQEQEEEDGDNEKDDNKGENKNKLSLLLTEDAFFSKGHNGKEDTEYNADTHVLNFVGQYASRGWWFGTGDEAKDASAYTKFTVVFSNATGEDPFIEIGIQYAEGESDKKNGVFDKDGFALTIGLDETRKSKITQAYVQGGAAGNTATIKEAYFE